jgi:cation/acetate symporter
VYIAQDLAKPGAVGIVFFFVFVAVAIGVAYWAARRTRTTEQFYAAGHSITGVQNGFALAGDYMSAASFLGIAGLVALFGFDGLIYSIGFLVGWPIVLFLIAEPLRNLGKYTFTDVVAFRLRQRPVRIAAGFGTLCVVVFYLIAQMVGAGALIDLMFGIDYSIAVVIVGVVMTSMLLLGGMIATTWVQIIKAVLLLGGALTIAVWTLAEFGLNPLDLFDDAAGRAETGEEVLGPGDQIVKNAPDAISLGLALMFGTAGLPHILMRFYTVPDTRAARASVTLATILIGFFYLLTFVLGFGAMALVGQGTITEVEEAGNMAAPLLAEELGGDVFLGFIAAVAFATILAVVAGLTLAGAAALSHDLWTNTVRGGEAPEREQLQVARIATVILGAAAVGLGIAMEGQNVAFMVGLAFAIAASANFPALVMSIYWRRFTTAGAVTSILLGAISAVVLIYLSPTFQVDVLGNEDAPFGLGNPAIISIPLAFIGGIVASLLTRETDAERKFLEAERQIHLGAAVTPAPERTPAALPAER